MNELDFNGLGAHLLNQIRILLPDWLPGGRINGHEWCCGDLRGGPGDSMRVNMNTGRWADFASNDKGGDLISLYAAVYGKNQVEAFRELCEQSGYNPTQTHLPPSTPATVKQAELVVPPPGTKIPEMRHGKFGLPTASWPYYDQAGQLMFIVARYATPTGKEFLPWSWNGTKWVCKGWPAPRPLYNLHKLNQRPTAPVIICEGEKAADAAEKLTGGRYVGTTWPNGAKAANRAQWEFLAGRKILIWPDNDAPGREAADSICRTLTPMCPEVKIIDPKGQPDGWDAADALDGGWQWDGFKEWATPRAVKIEINVNNEDQGAVSGSTFGLWEKLGLALSNQGSPITNIDNACKIIEGIKELRGIVWLDRFYQRILTKWNCNDARPWTDADTLHLVRIIQRDYCIRRMSKDTVYDAVCHVAAMNEKNEPRDWMDTLVWDGKPRVETFFRDYMGVEDSPYTLAASKNWWVAIAARTYWPGCQMDNVVILKGRQGARKSSSLRVIGGKWYACAGDNVLSKDFYEILQGKLLVEIAELAGFGNAEIETIKRVVSNPTDRFRVSYGRIAEDHPRQCVFVATTNEDSPLRDHTGGRRFWPVHVGSIDIDRITADRAQLFAEAVHLYKNGATWYQMPEYATEQVQEDSRQGDVWEDYIHAWLDSHMKTETTVSELAHEVLHITVDKIDKHIQIRIGRCLTALGWERKVIWRNNKSVKVWVKKILTQEDGKEPLVW